MAAEERDPHRDPLSDESGSHPVGTGVGAAGGAVAGAAAGMSGGPLGMAAGGVVGAVVGSLAGRAAAEAIHPTAPAAHEPARIASSPHDTTSPPVGHTTWEYEDEVILRPDTYPESGPVMAPVPTLATSAAPTTPDLASSGAPDKTSNRREDVIDVLQDLLACCSDSVSSYRSWAEHARHEDLQATFTQRMHDCQRGAWDLQDQIRSLGGDARNGGSARDALRRGWATVKSTLATGNDAARLEEAERSEDHALARYHAALQQPLPEAVRSLVERQLRAVQRHHDQIRSLRERLRTAN